MSIFERFQNLGKVKTDFEEYEHQLTPLQEQILDQKTAKPVVFYILATIIFLLLIAQTFNLQIIQGSKNRLLAEGNRLRIRQIPAPRGLIYDKNNTPLVENQSAFSLEIYPADLPKEQEKRQEIYKKVIELTGIDPKAAEKIEAEKNKTESIILADKISGETALYWKMKLYGTPGVVLNLRPTRIYKSDAAMGHLLGYVGKINQDELQKLSDYTIQSEIGKVGLEKFYEQFLRGQNGQEQVEVNAAGQTQRILSSVQPEQGNNLYLTLDYNLQKQVSDALSNQLNAQNLSKGVAIVINPQNGAILAMVSLPSYDDNLFSISRGPQDFQKLIQDPNRPLFDRAVAGQYPSGSSIKPMIASAALQEKVISSSTTINDKEGNIQIGQWSFPDWKAHGIVDVKKAIAESCNVFFYTVGGGFGNIKGLGVERIKKYLHLFGWGNTTGVDLPGEEKGLLPDPAWKKAAKGESWYIGDTYHLAIGQGDVLVTPLQLLNSIATIANGGTLYRPHFLSKITTIKGEELRFLDKDIIRSNFISKENLEVVQEGMRQTVTSGSGTSLSDLPVKVAGKTGTAQFGKEGKTHAWFAGYAPYDNPQMAVIVLIEGGGEGYASAAPVARQIFQAYFGTQQ
jgi:penicillin-binding protein 2